MSAPGMQVCQECNQPFPHEQAVGCAEHAGCAWTVWCSEKCRDEAHVNEPERGEQPA